MKVLIVDDQPLVRDGLAALLSLEEGVQVIGTAADGVAALSLAEAIHPDVVLMDIRMPGMNGVEAARQFRARGGPPVVLLTTFEEEEDMVEGVRAGAAGYLFKTAEVQEIMAALKRVVGGERVFHPRVTQSLAETLSRPRPAPLPFLTAREVEILRCLASGAANKRIAAQLHITEGTVKIHVSSILNKLKATSRTDAVRIAQQRDLL